MKRDLKYLKRRFNAINFFAFIIWGLGGIAFLRYGAYEGLSIWFLAVLLQLEDINSRIRKLESDN